LHGGFSTGPKTAEGIERIRRGRLKHGRYTKAATVERAQDRALLSNLRELIRMGERPRSRLDQRLTEGRDGRTPACML
jgi:hypothetical protein